MTDKRVERAERERAERVELTRGSPKGMVLALSRECPVCGARAGQYCTDEGVPKEAQPGWHTEREELAQASQQAAREAEDDQTNDSGEKN